ncbi:MAG: hypothetical protein FGM15_09725 [Chthoniobacterales bacterium]|nr:hypothetical protein [Chthoniobacterales bacterium]
MIFLCPWRRRIWRSGPMRRRWRPWPNAASSAASLRNLKSSPKQEAPHPKASCSERRHASAVANGGCYRKNALMKNFTLAFVVFAIIASPLWAQQAPVDWKTLAAEFAQDQAAATAKYQGKLITVTGPVASIAAGDMTVDDPSVAVILSSADGPGPDVKCLFQNEDLPVGTEIYVTGDGSEAILRKKDSAGNLTSSEPLVDVGQQIVATGSFLSYDGGDIVLQHCRLDKEQPE